MVVDVKRAHDDAAQASLKKVWILLLNWKNATDTIECLGSILKSDDKMIAGIVICDNGSDDGSVEAIQDCLEDNQCDWINVRYQQKKFLSSELERVRQASLPFVMIENGENLGFAAGNNIGLTFIEQFTEFDYVFVLNNDTVIEPDTVTNCIMHFEKQETMGLCGCKVVYHHTPSLVQAYSGASYDRIIGRAVNIGGLVSTSNSISSSEVEKQLDYILGAAMMISKHCLKSIGLMEERYFLYYEEIDWATRAKQMGYTLGFANNSVVYHKEGASIGSSYEKSGRSLLSDYYLVSSRIKFTAKFFPYYLPSVYLFSLFQALRVLLRFDGSRFLVIFKALLQVPFKKN